MNAALKVVLGDHVHQKGSNITAERMRFDFSHTAKMTPEEVKETENEIARGVVVPTSDDVIGLKRKLTGGCGSIHLQVYFDRVTGKMSEVFINKGGSGGWF